MMKSGPTKAYREALESESAAWVNQLFSGAVSPEQAADFARWRTTSPEHAQAFEDAIRFRRDVQRLLLTDRQHSDLSPSVRPTGRHGSHVSRRAWVGGALAATGVAYIAAQAPGHLWPSWSELTSDFRTQTGEQNTVRLSDGVFLQMNTRTSIARAQAGGRSEIALISGEAVVTLKGPRAQPFVIAAGLGRTLISDGGVDVRHDGGRTCVTCLNDTIEILHPLGRLRLRAGRQASYSAQGVTAPVVVDAAAATAWRRGLLIFRDAPLQKVVDELNRYRPGRIILVNPALYKRPVYGVFQIHQLGRAVQQVQALTGAKATSLPGGLALLS